MKELNQAILKCKHYCYSTTKIVRCLSTYFVRGKYNKP